MRIIIPISWMRKLKHTEEVKADIFKRAGEQTEPALLLERKGRRETQSPTHASVLTQISSNWRQSSRVLRQARLPCSRTRSLPAAKAEEPHRKFRPVLKPTPISTWIFNRIQHRGGGLHTNKFLQSPQKRQKGSTSLYKTEKL